MEIVSGDETCIHHFDTEKKKVWVASDGQGPVIARRNKTVSKAMYTIFFDGHGPVLEVPVGDWTVLQGADS